MVEAIPTEDVALALSSCFIAQDSAAAIAVTSDRKCRVMSFVATGWESSPANPYIWIHNRGQESVIMGRIRKPGNTLYGDQ